MHYVIRKDTTQRAPWGLFRKTETGSLGLLGRYHKRREAVTTGRLLAGRTGKLDLELGK